jgi:Alginate O-acetyl transferase AlgF
MNLICSFFGLCCGVMNQKILALFAIISVLFPAAAQAEEGLYPKPPPPGSAFVRILEGASMPYAAIPSGPARVNVAGQAAKGQVEAGRHYSAFIHNGKAMLLQDPEPASRLKAQLLFFNLTDHPITFVSGETVLAENVPPGAAKPREVNPVTAAFSVQGGASTQPVALERGTRYVVVARDGGVTIAASPVP